MRQSLLPLALVFSGFGALAVEVLWERLLTPVLGGSTIAVTAVLIAYMGGLALGAGIAGRLGDKMRPQRALRAYIILELLVWLAATATTLVLTALPVGVAGALAALPAGPVRFLGRFLIASALLLLPTTAMGATLPFAVRASVGGSVGRLLSGSALLYTANTAGAVAGALAGPLLLLPALGVRYATLVGATGSLLASLVGLLAKPVSEEQDQEEPVDPEGDKSSSPAAWVLLATFSTGAASLGLEVVWTRALGTVAGSTVYAFGVVLALVLGGIALGSAAVSIFGRRAHRPALARTILAILAVAGPTLAVLVLPALDWIPARFAALTTEGALTFRASLWIIFSVGALVILPPTLCFGAALPLAIRAARSRAWASARSVSRVYVANTLGSLAGAAGTGLLLMPSAGQARAADVLALLPLAAGLLLWLAPSRVFSARRLVPTLLVAAAAVSAIFLCPTPSTLAAAAGIHSNRKRVHVNVAYYGEGPEASVLVEASGPTRTFFVAGRPEASDIWYDVRTQYLLGHLPALVAGGAQKSLVIGLGSGMTAGALTEHGQVIIAELNRAVPGAAAQFRDFNHDVLHRARGRMLPVILRP